MRRPSLGTHHLRLPVLRTWQSGLIFLHDGRPRAVGKSQVHHKFYPTSTEPPEGELLRVVSHKVDMRGRTLRGLIERLDKRQTYYLSGEMMVGSASWSESKTLISTGPSTVTGRRSASTMRGWRNSAPTSAWWRRRGRWGSFG